MQTTKADMYIFRNECRIHLSFLCINWTARFVRMRHSILKIDAFIDFIKFYKQEILFKQVTKLTNPHIKVTNRDFVDSICDACSSVSVACNFQHFNLPLREHSTTEKKHLWHSLKKNLLKSKSLMQTIKGFCAKQFLLFLKYP